MADANPTPTPEARDAFITALDDLARCAELQRQIVLVQSATAEAVLAAQIAAGRAF